MCDEVVLDEFRVCVSMYGSESIKSNSRVVMSYLEKYSEDEFTSSREILGKRRLRFRKYRLSSFVLISLIFGNFYKKMMIDLK